MVEDILYRAVNKAHGGLVVTTAEVQLENVLEGVIAEVTGRNPFLSLFLGNKSITGGREPVRRKPYEIRFATGYYVIGRAMAEEGRTLLGRHEKDIWGDEAQMFTRRGWNNMQQSMKGARPRERYFGVPDGRRDVFYEMDTTTKRFDGQRLKLPSYYNPEWGEAMKARLLEAYGGEETDVYKQNVLGEHGAATRGVWDVDILVERNFQDTSLLDGRWFEITQQDVEEGLWEDTLRLLPGKGADGRAVIAVDCGFVAPSVIGIFVERGERWEMLGRLNLLRVPYDAQARILYELVRKYGARAVGLDASGADGQAIADVLKSMSGEETRLWINRVVFHSKVPSSDSEISSETYAAVLATRRLRNWFAEGRFMIPRDPGMVMEFSAETETASRDRVLYRVSPGATDHIIAMWRVLALTLYELDNNAAAQGYAMPLPRVVAWPPVAGN